MADASVTPEPMGRLRELVKMVERALVLRGALSGFVWTATTAGTCALIAAMLAPEAPRWPWMAIAPLGALLGALHARRNLPRLADLVLFVDRRLKAGEAIVSAFELGPRIREERLFETTLATASRCLERARPEHVAPRVVRRDAWGFLVAALAFTLAFVAPVPPPLDPPLGTDTVIVTHAQGLERIERIHEFVSADASRSDFEELAEGARELRTRLEEGVERRWALDRIEVLRHALEDALDRESAGRSAAALAAAEALADEAEMAEAVRRRDLESLSRAAERAATRREARDRERARRALEEAARAARTAGDESLAETLLERARDLEARAEQAALARELADAMPELADALRDGLERLERDGESEPLTRALVDAMREAWNRLSSEDRQRLAQALRDAPRSANTDAEGRTGSEGMPNADELERMLREALEHLDRLQVAIGRSGAPVPGGTEPSANRRGSERRGGGSDQQGQQGQGQQGQAQGRRDLEGPGAGHDGPGGPGPAGDTASTLETPSMIARVRPSLRDGVPSRRAYVWSDPRTDRPGEAGRATGPGAGGEQRGVERNVLPEDYREHVRAYFGGNAAPAASPAPGASIP